MTELKVPLLPNQKTIFYDNHRFKIICAGRRFGKSKFASYVVLLCALQNADATYYLVSPVYKQTAIIWHMIKTILREWGMTPKVLEGEKCIKFDNGARIFAMSGDNPDSLRGEKLAGCILDEAAMLAPAVWNEAIRPALADSKGWCIMISTPKGKNWFYEMFLRGQDTTQSDYKSFQYTTYDNPTIDKSEIDDMISQLPELAYKQEIMANFIEGGGMVFRNFEACIRDEIYEQFQYGKIYVMGVDLGRHEDFTVIVIAEPESRKIVYIERFNQSDWEYIKGRIKIVNESYGKPICYLDSTGIGDPVSEDLIKMGVPVSPYHMNASTKPILINNLAVTIENRQIILPNDEELKKELSAYSYKITINGHIQYNAPEGFFDDMIIGVALAVYGLGDAASTIGLVDNFKDTEIVEGEFDYDDITDVLKDYEEEEFWGEKNYKVKKRYIL